MARKNDWGYPASMIRKEKIVNRHGRVRGYRIYLKNGGFLGGDTFLGYEWREDN